MDIFKFETTTLEILELLIMKDCIKEIVSSFELLVQLNSKNFHKF